MSKLILCIAILFTCLQAQAVNKSSFTDEELETLSPFDPQVQEKVLKDVLRLMNETYDPKIESPQVRITQSVKPEETAIIEAAESQGMPAWALEKSINIFLFDLNIILVGEDRKIHNLAHEYAHFVQLAYKKYEKKEFAMDHTEMGAVEVQNFFRN